MASYIFDGFFAKLGGCSLDTTKSTHSLPNLVTLIGKYGDAELKQLLPEVEVCLSEKGGAFARRSRLGAMKRLHIVRPIPRAIFILLIR